MTKTGEAAHTCNLFQIFAFADLPPSASSLSHSTSASNWHVMDFSDPLNPKKYYFNVCRPMNPVLGCDRHASVCQMKYEQVWKTKHNLADYLPASDHSGAACGASNHFSSFKCALCSLQGSMKEVVSVSNMGIAKGGPIIEDRDRLLLKFTDGSVCTSDGQKLSYSTLIYLACSRGAQVRRICASQIECIFLAPSSLVFSVSVVMCVVEEATFPDVPELHRFLHVGDQGRLRCCHHQEQSEFPCSILLSSWD